MLEPYHGRVYDPACGSGGMFVQSAEFVKAHGGKRTDISVYGQESTDTTWQLAKMNLALRGIEADLGDRSADSFTQDLHPDLRADFVLANPPFNVSNWWDAKLARRPALEVRHAARGQRQLRLGPALHPPPRRPNGHGRLRPRQRLAVVARPAARARSAEARRGRPGRLHRRDARQAVLQHRHPGLPLVRLARTGTATATASATGEVLFIDARKLGAMETRRLRVLNDDDIAKIADTYHAWRNHDGGYEDVPGFCKAAHRRRDRAARLRPHPRPLRRRRGSRGRRRADRREDRAAHQGALRRVFTLARVHRTLYMRSRADEPLLGVTRRLVERNQRASDKQS